MTNEKLKAFLEANSWKQETALVPIWPELENEIWIKTPFAIYGAYGETIRLQLVLMYTIITIHGNTIEFISIDIKLEQAGIWYNLQAYSISPKEFMEKHVEIENKLIALSNTLCL